MKIKWLLWLHLFLAITTVTSAQSVSGEVRSDKGEILQGVTVAVKGTSSGTVTDSSGRFSIQAPAGSSLVFSFTGFTPREITVNGKQHVSIVLQYSIGQLDEVVVTALGIKSTKKSINYSVQNLKGAEVAATKETNIVSALSGKVAGVQINNSSGQPGGSATIRIRGSASVLGENSPLFILDGMPIDNSNIGLSIQNANQIVNQSNRAVDLNPNDIESVAVLKGPAAAALYGIRASNGAVVITSKKGGSGKKTRKLKVSLYSRVTVENVARRLQPLQWKFGQGFGGKYLAPGQNGSEDSWGPLLDTLTYSTTPSKWDVNGAIVGQSDPTSNGIPVNRYDNIGHFFKTGYTTDNSLSVSGKTERFGYYFSFGRLYQKGIVPTTDFFRNTARFGGTFQASDQLDFSVSANYFNTGSGNRMLPGGAPGGALRSLMNTPANFDITNGLSDPAHDPRSYTFEDGSQRAYAGGTFGFDGPFWSLNNNPHTDNNNRVVLVEETNYRPFSWLTATFRVGTDVFNEKRMALYNKGSVAFPAGVLVNYTFLNRDINTDFYLTASKKLGGRFNLKVIAGHNYFDHQLDATVNQGNNLNLPGFENISNGSTFNVRQETTQRRLVAGYASAELDYRNWLILNVTGRNEWTSTLAKGKNSFFYPSVNLGWIVNESLNWDVRWLDYLKLRASYAQVGNDAQPYSLGTYYSSTTVTGSAQGQTLNFPFNGLAGYSLDPTLGNKNLKPERITSYEGGVEAWFFRNRLGVEATVYKNESRDQILPVSIPASTGYSHFITNAGLITNSGAEAIVTGVIVNKRNFRWTAVLNFSHNKSFVHALTGDNSMISLMSTNGGQQIVAPGYAFSVIYGRALRTSADGRVLIDDREQINGAPNGNYGQPLAEATPSVIGDPNPLWNAGLRNTLSYKDITLSFLFDNRQHFDIYNSTRAQLVNNGVAKETENRYDEIVFDGVGLNSGKPNTIKVVPGESWYKSTIGYGSVFVEKDLWWLRLRDVNLSYSFPESLLRKLRLSELELTLTGRNLITWTNYTGSDPDVNLRGGFTNGYGSDFFNYPTTKSYGAALRVSF